MMNFESVIQLFLSNPATLTSMVVSFSRLFIHSVPVLPVIWEVSTLPTWAILAVYIFGLPFSHTLTTAKILFFYFGVFAAELLTAIIAVKYFASPSEKRKPARITASKFFAAVQSVWLYFKLFSANRAVKRNSTGLTILINSPTFTATKPKSAFVIIQSAWFSFKVFFACMALNYHNCFHKFIIPYIIAAHNLNRRCYAMEISEKYGAVILERYFTATGITPELVD